LKKDVAHVHHVGLDEVDHRVAVGVGRGHVVDADLVAVPVERDRVREGDDRQRGLGRRLDLPAERGP